MAKNWLLFAVLSLYPQKKLFDYLNFTGESMSFMEFKGTDKIYGGFLDN